MVVSRPCCPEVVRVLSSIYRQLKEPGHAFEVVAPRLTPRKSEDRVKTDRRDAVTLARLHRAGELTAVWVSEGEQEAIRDLTRNHEDMKATERHLRQRLGAFLLRHGKVCGVHLGDCLCNDEYWRTEQANAEYSERVEGNR